MKKHKLLKLLLGDPQGSLLLGFLIMLYRIYFLTALSMVGYIMFDMIVSKGYFEISEGKSVLFIFFIGQLIYLINHPKLLNLVIDYQKFYKIGIGSLLIGSIVIMLVRWLY